MKTIPCLFSCSSVLVAALWLTTGPALAQKTNPGPDQVLNQFQQWQDRFKAAPDSKSKAALVPEGIALAQARRGIVQQLIRGNPERAVQIAVPDSTRRGMPPQVADQLEE